MNDKKLKINIISEKKKNLDHVDGLTNEFSKSNPIDIKDYVLLPGGIEPEKNPQLIGKIEIYEIENESELALSLIEPKLEITENGNGIFDIKYMRVSLPDSDKLHRADDFAVIARGFLLAKTTLCRMQLRDQLSKLTTKTESIEKHKTISWKNLQELYKIFGELVYKSA